jgi:hypothetical protein
MAEALLLMQPMALDMQLKETGQMLVYPLPLLELVVLLLLEA